MVKTICAFLLLLCSLGVPTLALPQGDNPESSSAQDRLGLVWKLPSGSSNGALSCWQNGDWTARTIPGTDGFHAVALTRGGGFVYVLWQGPALRGETKPRCLVTVQRGGGSRILAHFDGPVVREAGFPSVPSIFARADGDIWVAGYQPLLWHITSEGGVQTFPLKPEQYVGGKLPDSSLVFQSLSSVLDAQGQRWFWQVAAQTFPSTGGLRGILIWNGKALDYHPTLRDMPDRPFSTFAPLDANHLWLTVAAQDYAFVPARHGALYQIDTRTLTTARETPPRPGAFQNVTQVFRANGDLYVLANNQNRITYESVLWRQHAGAWREMLGRLEGRGGDYRPDDEHPWVAEPTGTWLGVSGGAWWLPRGNQPPLWVNWRRGLAVHDVSALFPLTSGKVLACGPQEAAEMLPTPPPIRPLPPGVVTGGLGAPEQIGPLMADARHHLWGTQTYHTQTLSLDEWDGTRWNIHLPPNSISGVSGLYACDTLGRLWLTTQNWNPPAQPQPVVSYVIYDPVRDTWTSYASQPDALAAAAALPHMAFLPRHDLYQPPVFSGDGHVAYVSDNTNISLYDGKSWRNWAARGILPTYGYGNLPNTRFSQKGLLETALPDQYWAWTAEGKWEPTGDQKSTENENSVPPNSPHGLRNVSAVDGLGVKWFVGNDAVYAAGYGLWAKEDELSAFGSPFRSGYIMEDVLHDPAGRLFFVSRPAGYYDFVVWSPPPVPAPALSVVFGSDDSVTVRFEAKLSDPHWFLWRLNGGAWSAPTTESALALTALGRGNYTLEAEALDRHLLASAPASAVFRIQVAPETQIARWVQALLSGTDNAREAAVAGLVKQPEAARAALEAARPGASESGRWWIDAALQQVEERRR